MFTKNKTHKIKINEIEMAGTTINEQNIVYKSLHKAINKFGIEVSLELVLSLGAGKEKHKAIKDILKHINNTESNKSDLIFEYFKEILDQEYLSAKVLPIEGVENVLLNLKKDGIKVVLNTGYSCHVANTLLQKLNWKKDNQFDALITADDVVPGRPFPDMIHKAMQLVAITNASKVLKVGDSAIDIEEGKITYSGSVSNFMNG